MFVRFTVVSLALNRVPGILKMFNIYFERTVEWMSNSSDRKMRELNKN